jgi:IS30 family transposase
MPATSTKTGPKAKLTSADQVQIRAMIERNMNDAQIAAAFGVSRPTINRLRHYLAKSEPKPVNELQAMIRAEDKRRAIRDEIFEAYHSGDSVRVAELWALERSI